MIVANTVVANFTVDIWGSQWYELPASELIIN